MCERAHHAETSKMSNHAPPAGTNRGKNHSRSKSLKETTAATGDRDPHKTPPDTETLNSICFSPSDSLFTLFYLPHLKPLPLFVFPFPLGLLFPVGLGSFMWAISSRQL